MRIFLGAFGQPGHAFPMLALGAKLAERGHRVTFETWERWRDPVTAAGIEFLAAPEYQPFPTRELPLKPYEAVVRATPVTLDAIAERSPDVVVHDILTLAPALAGELHGAPVATLVPHLYPVGEPGLPPYGLGARLPRTDLGRVAWSRLDPLIETGLRRGRRELNETRRRLGLPPVSRLHGGISSELCLVASLPQLEYPREWPASVHLVGPLLWEPPAPEVELPRSDTPLVLVAPSTSHDPAQRMVRAALAGLRRTDVRVVGVTNRRPLPRGARTGGGARLVDWLSYERSMPHCSLVVCHGGFGTLARALTSGTPVLVVPHSGDMGENAARVDWARVGVRLPWRLLSPLTLRLAVARVFEPDAGYAARAAEVAGWAAANDAATRAAELVEALGTSRRQA
jgi:UDP:flavonoid glycosyltransferase YjiC (YdhE family)